MAEAPSLARLLEEGYDPSTADVMAHYRPPTFPRRLRDLAEAIPQPPQPKAGERVPGRFAGTTRPVTFTESFINHLVGLPPAIAADQSRGSVPGIVVQGMELMPLTDAFRAFRDRYGPFADPGSADLTPPPQDRPHLRDLSDLGAFYRNIAQQLDAAPLPMVPQSLLNRESTNVDDRRPWWQRKPPGGNFDYSSWRKELDRMMDELDRLQDWSRNR